MKSSLHHPAPAEFASGALMSLVGRRYGVPTATATLVTPAAKRALLVQLHKQHGRQGLLEAGREVAAQTEHPFVRVLTSQVSPARMLGVWARLEVLAHSANRVQVLALNETSLEVLRRRVPASSRRRTTLEEDLLILGVIEGLLARFGLAGFREQGPFVQPGGRRWRITFRQGTRPQAVPAGRIWCAEGVLERAAFAATASLLHHDERAEVSAVARLLSLSPRTLQRRLAHSGASFSSLLRAARIASVGAFIASEDRALTEAAHRFGFSDSAHLCREFRSLIGCTPSDFARAAHADGGA